uniref:C-type lectin domain-containing protein n=1 Tax=Branchiostoma floridae TaxID=7739 RepID=C3YTD0_BRAFL|eukprot:XP_002600485.1 hypothetical protein BRAFLDRAFT_205272 [Branchiostoma floridae]
MLLSFSVCPSGYQPKSPSNGICYKAFKTHKTFSEAAETCRQQDGTLAMPKDDKTNRYLVAISYTDETNPYDQDAWIGLRYKREQEKFEWVDGTPFGSYSAWGTGQPDHYEGTRGEDCVSYFRLGGQPYKWNVFPCFIKRPFVCQYNLDELE